MKRFRFSLERLYRLRGHQERTARRELGQALSVVRTLDAQLRTIEANLAICEDQCRAAHSLGAAIGRGLQIARCRLEGRIETAELQVEQAREAYRERRTELRSLTRLREKRITAWRDDSLAEEQVEWEELTRAASTARRREEEAR